MKYNVYEEGWDDPIATFDTHDEAETFALSCKEEDAREGYYSSRYIIRKGEET